MTCEAALSNEYNVSTTSPAASKRGAGYAVYDPLGQRIGSAEEVFVNRNEEPKYVRVRVGFFGQKSVLIPVQFAEVNDERRILFLK
jgi:PRC-barrel domain